MATFGGFNEVRPVPVLLYTASTRNKGELRSGHFRFSDAMNALDQDFVVLFEATVQPLHAARAQEFSASSVLIRRDHIVIGMPWTSQAGVERPPVQQGLQVERVPLRAIFEVSPFTIEGVVHLTPGVHLLQHVHDPHRYFMPVSNATVQYHPSPLLSFDAPFLMVNRRLIEVVLDTTELGQRSSADPDVAKPKVVAAGLSGVRAAELLASTEVFKVVDLPALQRTCTELCESGRMSRKVYVTGAEVFHQGDVGDTLYVVESGKVEVYVTDPRSRLNQHLADFGAGSLFGEMAILGDDRRTATVRAVIDSSLVAIQKDAVKQLLQQFPSATTRLLAIMVERKSGLSAASKSLLP